MALILLEASVWRGSVIGLTLLRASSLLHQIFGAETVAFRPWRKRRSLSWVLVEVRIEACRVSQLCGGNVEKSIERIAVHLLPVDATAGWFRLILCVG